MAGWRQRLEQHTSCVTDELEEEDGIHTIEREACSRESHATVRVRTTLGSEASRVQVPASDTNQSRTLQYGESENTWKLTGSRMTLIERGLGAKPVSSKSHAKALSAQLQNSKSLLAHEQQQWFDPRSTPFVTPPSTRSSRMK
jgi:hypothetical protein